MSNSVCPISRKGGRNGQGLSPWESFRLLRANLLSPQASEMRKGIKIETYIFEKTGVFSTVRHPKISNRDNAIATLLNLCNVLPDNIVPHGNTEVAFHQPRGGAMNH